MTLSDDAEFVEVWQRAWTSRRKRGDAGVVGQGGIAGVNIALDGGGAAVSGDDFICGIGPSGLGRAIWTLFQDLDAVVDGVGVRFRGELGIDAGVGALFGAGPYTHLRVPTILRVWYAVWLCTVNQNKSKERYT